MAPWSWWPQSTPRKQQQQQQQQDSQEEPPPPPPIPKTSNPPLNQAPILLSNGYPRSRADDIWERKISPTELKQIATRSLQTGAITGPSSPPMPIFILPLNCTVQARLDSWQVLVLVFCALHRPPFSPYSLVSNGLLSARLIWVRIEISDPACVVPSLTHVSDKRPFHPRNWG